MVHFENLNPLAWEKKEKENGKERKRKRIYEQKRQFWHEAELGVDLDWEAAHV